MDKAIKLFIPSYQANNKNAALLETRPQSFIKAN